MNRYTLALTLALLLPPASEAGFAPESLEPCINGGVSALGLYPTQAQEDAAMRTRIAELDLEPCINGGVSASGTYPTQAQEDRARIAERSVAGIVEQTPRF